MTQAIAGSPFLAVESVPAGSLQNIPDDDATTIANLFKTWADKYPRNLIRTRYVEARETFQDFGIGIPDAIKRKAMPMIGWPAKAVRALADLSVFEGFSLPGDTDPYGIRGIEEDNALDVEVPQAITSAYTHSCSFMTVAKDPESGHMLIMPRSADWSAALWDSVNRRIGAALTITDDDESGRITGFNAWLPGRVYTCEKHGREWSSERVDTGLSTVSVVPLCYDAQLNRPFGRSRVSRPLMALTDIGFRTIVRMEGNAEFYMSPKLWFLGAEQDAFSADTWSSLISAINAISKDEDGDTPSLQQMQQASMQPHSDMLKTIALMVASETNLPVNDLGITMDNPPSAEAMAAAERKLSREADRQNLRFGRAVKDATMMAVCMRDDLAEPPDDLKAIRPVWSPTREVSDAARADAFSKIASVSPEFAQTEAGWRYAGFDQKDIELILGTVRKAQASNTLDKLIGASHDNQSAGQPAGPGAAAVGQTGPARDAGPVADNTGPEPAVAA